MSFGIPVRNGLAIGLLASTTLSSRRGLSPALFLDFLQPFLDSRITFSRGTGATRVNASGFIEVVGNTTPRFDYDPVTLAPRGLLIEEARTNLLTYSEQFDNAAWAKANANVLANVIVSPDGTTNADILRLNAGTAITTAASGLFTSITTYVSEITPTLTAAAYTYSLYVKGGAGLSHVQLRTSLSASLTPAVAETIIRLSDGAVISGTNIVVTAMRDGWYRIAMPFTATAAVHHCGVWFWNSTSIASATGNEGIYVYGAQLEAGAFATSYIPTVASTVSRSADIATMTGTNFSSWYNQAEGTFITETTPIGPTSFSAIWMFAVGDGSPSGNVLGVNHQSPITTVRGVVTNAGGTVQFSATQAASGTTTNKTAIAAKLNDFAFSVNGAAPTLDATGTMPTPNRLALGAETTLGSVGNSWLRAIAYYNTRLPNTQLQTLTAPSLASPLALDFISPTYTVGY